MTFTQESGPGIRWKLTAILAHGEVTRRSEASTNKKAIRPASWTLIPAASELPKLDEQ